MYTAKITNKEFVKGALKVTVLFSDGVTNVEESCIPQDLNGLKFWVKSRLDTFNGGIQINTDYDIDSPIEPDVEPEPPAPTAEDIARIQWFKEYNKWLKIKETLINTGVLTGSEPQAVALLNKVKNDFKVAYLNYL